MLQGKVALITGANGGLGAAVTRAFLQAGAQVHGVAKAIQDSEFSHPAFHAMPAEIKSADQARALVSAVIARAGQIDALIHRVGGFAGGRTVEDTGSETLDHMLDVNLRPAFHMLQAVLPPMRARRGGAIVAIGSRTAVTPQPMLGAYSASKAALVSLIGTVALECKRDGITANVVLPGAMDTPANRAANPAADPAQWIQPDQIAALLVHLASPAAAQITGAVIPVYGRDL